MEEQLSGLHKYYSRLADLEILSLLADRESLTEEAVDVLEGIARQRGIEPSSEFASAQSVGETGNGGAKKAVSCVGQGLGVLVAMFIAQFAVRVLGHQPRYVGVGVLIVGIAAYYLIRARLRER